MRCRDGTLLRPLNLPTPVEVRTDGNGRPLALRTRRGRPVEPVAQIRESWRIDDEWWRRPVSRHYHQVALEGGRIATLYRDLTDGRWYEQ
jgi:hypothetical protein